MTPPPDPVSAETRAAKDARIALAQRCAEKAYENIKGTYPHCVPNLLMPGIFFVLADASIEAEQQQQRRATPPACVTPQQCYPCGGRGVVPVWDSKRLDGDDWHMETCPRCRGEAQQPPSPGAQAGDCAVCGYPATDILHDGGPLAHPFASSPAPVAATDPKDTTQP